MMKEQVGPGDIVYLQEENVIGYISGYFRDIDCEPSYNIVTNELFIDGWFRCDVVLSQYNLNGNIIVLSKGDFK